MAGGGGPLETRIAELRASLLGWYDAHRRELPWRGLGDPYAVWVSEVMLQQTRAQVVRERFPRFLERFPTLDSLAAAREDDVLAAWSGLGYYARARNIRLAAREVVARHGGRLPADPVSLRALPGFGRYTANATASIAFGVPVPVVDGNVARLLARWSEIRQPLGSSAAERALWRVAARLLPPGRPGDWNQALMEVGATICRPRRPRCGECPARGGCRAAEKGIAERLPRRARRAPSGRERRAVAVIERAGRLLLVRSAEPRLLRGLWQFPGVVIDGDADAAGALRRALDEIGVVARSLRRDGIVRHAIMNRTIDTEVFAGSLAAQEPVNERAMTMRWVRRSALLDLPLSAVGLRIARRLSAAR